MKKYYVIGIRDVKNKKGYLQIRTKSPGKIIWSNDSRGSKGNKGIVEKEINNKGELTYVLAVINQFDSLEDAIICVHGKPTDDERYRLKGEIGHARIGHLIKSDIISDEMKETLGIVESWVFDLVEAQKIAKAMVKKGD